MKSRTSAPAHPLLAIAPAESQAGKTPKPVAGPTPKPGHDAKFRRSPFYLKIDGLTGPRPRTERSEG